MPGELPTNIGDDRFQDYGDGEGVSGFFAYAASKNVSITKDQPMKGWVTLSFTDEDDSYSLNSQMFYVPAKLFDLAIDAYRPTKAST